MGFSTIISADSAYSIFGQALFIDTRHLLVDPDWGHKSYLESHIKGAYFAHLDQDLSGIKTGKNGRHPLPDLIDFTDFISKIGARKDQQIIIYDQDCGMYAARLWWMLRHWLGFRDVAVLDGGFTAWCALGHIVDADIPQECRGNQNPEADETKIVSTKAVLENLAHPHFKLIDARGAERYSGESEPIDPKAGHIPGALNRPFTENLENGFFKSPEMLYAEWQALLRNTSHEKIVHQCGSGVTACHNILSMDIAGMTNSRLYSGSWSAWCASDRPIKTGLHP